MGETTKIEWADATFNPWIGCERIGPGCDRCYAAAMALRTGDPELWQGQRRRISRTYWEQPAKWAAAARAEGKRKRIFCASMADVFDNAVPPEWRRDLLHMIGRNTDLDWLLLTKRIGNAARMLNEAVEALACGNHDWDFMPWSDIWLGATVCNQEEVDRDVPKLLAVNAAVRFLSIEPMLGPVNLAPHLGMWWNSTMDCWEGTGQYINRDQWGRKGIHWVIVGGETGHGARPIAERWVRDVQRQCQAAGVAFLFKQWGEWIPARQAPSQMVQAYLQKYRAYPTGFADGERVLRLGRGFAGRLFDEREWDAWPR